MIILFTGFFRGESNFITERFYQIMLMILTIFKL